jgi:histidine triad (HIT) family protein
MHSDPDCVFCKIVAGQIPCFKLCEDEATLAFMDINPAHEGHCLVISKDHAPTIFDIGEETLAAVARAVRRVSRAVNAALAPQGLSLVQANGEGAKQSVPHFHIHVLPRVRDDGLLLDWPLVPGDRDAIAAAAERIRRHL